MLSVFIILFSSPLTSSSEQLNIETHLTHITGSFLADHIETPSSRSSQTRDSGQTPIIININDYRKTNPNDQKIEININEFTNNAIDNTSKNNTAKDSIGIPSIISSDEEKPGPPLPSVDNTYKETILSPTPLPLAPLIFPLNDQPVTDLNYGII